MSLLIKAGAKKSRTNIFNKAEVLLAFGVALKPTPCALVPARATPSSLLVAGTPTLLWSRLIQAVVTSLLKTGVCSSPVGPLLPAHPRLGREGSFLALTSLQASQLFFLPGLFPFSHVPHNLSQVRQFPGLTLLNTG